MRTRNCFDYIVIGAGLAGCVLASRLSEDPIIRVALVEAGGLDDAPEINMPVAFSRKEGARCSPAGAVLRPVMQHRNLTVLTRGPGRQTEVQRRALHRPRFPPGRPVAFRWRLQRSDPLRGCDPNAAPAHAVQHRPQADPEQLGIETVVDLPGVGRNFQDHILLDALVDGVELGLDLASQPAIRDLITRWVTPPRRMSRQDTVALVRQSCTSPFHPVGTCAMGPDREAAVDAELRVHGTLGLRIADASVMPTIPSANTNAPSIMIGDFARPVTF